ncbi:MAG: phage tail assembly chaperone [Spirochaetes bacterium]|nr:phage tail assembly chaperone [Spirochaetota bacterium]
MQIRAERNALLAASDWTQLPDVKLAEKERAAYNKYRQTLRGIPQNYDDPDEIVWPDKI